jgi:hypothetical protein
MVDRAVGQPELTKLGARDAVELPAGNPSDPNVADATS